MRNGNEGSSDGDSFFTQVYMVTFNFISGKFYGTK
jgi:hypothetical protein